MMTLDKRRVGKWINLLIDRPINNAGPRWKGVNGNLSHLSASLLYSSSLIIVL